MIKSTDKVKFFFGQNVKTPIHGTVKSTTFRSAFVEITRVAGKFAKTCQKNIVCISKSQLEVI